jgi:hypothetical protein
MAFVSHSNKPAKARDRIACQLNDGADIPDNRVSLSEKYEAERLPEAQASAMLELEMACEAREVSIETVKQLLGLYAQAVDYFVAIQSDKCYYFKKKMASLMIKPQVVEAMDAAHQSRVLADAQKKQESGEISTPTQIPLQPTLATSRVSEVNRQWVDSQLRKQEFEVSRRLSGLGQATKVQELVLAHGLTTARNNVLVQGGLKQQLEALGNKLQLRKAQKTASTISGFTKEVVKEAAEASVRSNSREKPSNQQAGEATPFEAAGGLRRWGSHRVIPTRGGRVESLFSE